MIVDGRAIASAVLAEVRASVLPAVPVVRAIVVRPSPATQSYLRIKTTRAEEGGMRLDVVKLEDDAKDEDVINAVLVPGADAIIVQLPLPEGFNLEKILSSIPVDQDADVLSAAAYARFEEGEEGALVPPVAAGVWEILVRSGVEVKGKKIVVVGKGQLVGKPCGILLERNGGNVSFVVRSTPEDERKELLQSADIIVSGAGAAHIITADMVKEGVVLVDAGTSGSGGGVAGDIHPACSEKASIFTPVPGGVGPVAVACLFKNTAQLFSKKTSLK